MLCISTYRDIHLVIDCQKESSPGALERMLVEQFDYSAPPRPPGWIRISNFLQLDL